MQEFSRFGRQPFGLAKAVSHVKRFFRRVFLRKVNPEAAYREDIIRRFGNACAAGLGSRAAVAAVGVPGGCKVRWHSSG